MRMMQEAECHKIEANVATQAPAEALSNESAGSPDGRDLMTFHGKHFHVAASIAGCNREVTALLCFFAEQVRTKKALS